MNPMRSLQITLLEVESVVSSVLESYLLTVVFVATVIILCMFFLNKHLLSCCLQYPLNNDLCVSYIHPYVLGILHGAWHIHNV